MNKQTISRNFSRHAANYEAAARLQQQVAGELISQCPGFDGPVLDLGSGPGIIAKNSGWDVTSLDISHAMCRLVPGPAINADIEHLPFADNSFPFITSNLTMQWLQNLETAFAEIHRALAPNGKFAFTTFAPDSLSNLRAAFSYIDSEQHLMEFEHAIKIFAMLKKAGFTNLVMSSQKITYTYPDMISALRSIKNIGAGYGYGSHKALREKKYFQKLENIFCGITKSKQITLEWEVLYIHAGKN